MNATIRRQWTLRKSRIERRLEKTAKLKNPGKPVFTARNIHYEFSDRIGAIAHGGIGAFHLLAQRTGLIDAIDERLHLLKFHLPYHESDHVLNFAYNALCDGDCLQDIELRRNDEVFLNALGAERIPDPTTAGDFCRRFTASDVRTLLDVINDVRQRVWARQSADFFELARIDMDGVLVGTLGECKAGMDIAYVVTPVVLADVWPFRVLPSCSEYRTDYIWWIMQRFAQHLEITCGLVDDCATCGVAILFRRQIPSDCVATTKWGCGNEPLRAPCEVNLSHHRQMAYGDERP